jgi:hypothetical protein
LDDQEIDFPIGHYKFLWHIHDCFPSLQSVVLHKSESINQTEMTAVVTKVRRREKEESLILEFFEKYERC